MRAFRFLALTPLALLTGLACSSSTTVTPTPTIPACDVHAGGGTTYADKTGDWGLGDVVGNRIVTADLDGDGYPDLIINAIGATNKREPLDGTPPKLVCVLMNRPRQGGGRTFVDATVDSGFFQVRGGSTTELRCAQVASFGDIDNDGDLDVFSGTYVDPTNPTTDTGDRSEILLNDGKGHFTLANPSDPTPPKTALWPTTGATMADVDRDGKLDLFVGFWYENYGSDVVRRAGAALPGRRRRQLHVDHRRGRADDHRAAATPPTRTHKPVVRRHVVRRRRRRLAGAHGQRLRAAVEQPLPERRQREVQPRSARPRATPDATSTTAPSTHMGPTSSSSATARSTRPSRTASGVEAPATSARPRPTRTGRTAPTISRGATAATTSPRTAATRRRRQARPLLGRASTTGTSVESGDSSRAARQPAGRRGTITFERPGNATTGMVWPHPTSDWNEGGLMVAGGDLDDDGLEDLVVGASDYPDQFSLVFHQKPDHTFEEVGQAWGLHHACTSGLTIADFDRDGDLDVVVGSGMARDCGTIWKTNEVHFYENQSKHTRQVAARCKLVGNGTDTNKSGFGARVTVDAGTARRS